jgi:CHAT domain-containing protein/tetratricopeptide (TPR) repeat protein
MNFERQVLQFIKICLFICADFIFPSVIFGDGIISDFSLANDPVTSTLNIINIKPSDEVERLNISLKSYLVADDMINAKSTVEKLMQKIASKNIGESILSESYYLIGIYHLKSGSVNSAVYYLKLCVSIKEKKKEYDVRYAKAIYNLSVAFTKIGDMYEFKNYAVKSIEVGKKVYGESSPELLDSYLSLVSALIYMTEYEQALSNANFAVNMAIMNPDTTTPEYLAGLYTNIGLCHNKLGDPSKAKIYFDKVESIYLNYKLEKNDNYINLMNFMAKTYHLVGLEKESGEYYQRGVTLAISRNSLLAFDLINAYSVFLANNNEKKKGEALLKNAIDRAKTTYTLNPRIYYEVLFYYANYLQEYQIDVKKSIKFYDECLEYLRMNEHNSFFKINLYIGYSNALKDEGKYEKALGIIESLLIPDSENKRIDENYENPSAASLIPDLTSLSILKLKYNILWNIYKKEPSLETLEAASNTSELIVSLLDKVRVNINEDESRIILGNKYRDSYINAIHDFYLLYNKTSDRRFLEKAFEYSEKSKVADLLASTRELKATQFHVPPETGNLEQELQKEISLYNARISEAAYSENPDTILIVNLKENLLKATQKRDSLILVFEKQYPDYYALKYNTHVIDINKIPEVVGDDVNYMNYVVADTVLYTFVVNRKHQQLFAFPVDSSFYNEIKKFRNLLSMPLSSDNASLKLKEFQSSGYKLHKILIEPIRSFLISDKLLISPDNILSYLPFETIPESPENQKNLSYKDLNYLMNNFDISYAYSATFMTESVKKGNIGSNKLIAFAPDYPESIDIRSVLMSRQAGMGTLNDLPFARQEAEYVSDITNGKLFENSEAKESIYKKESGRYDIIHLAMHTLLNDKDPMHSRLIFSQKNDPSEDGYLNTYEIYGIPLKAKMVVLSSCNTGTGQLSSGEGILSLARGFLFSGSQSVVMSMWEIEDKSGTQIVEMFYKNLKKGYPKSIALKKARIAFLDNADMLRSHPYFWSSLVVYGNNSPLYYSWKMKICIAAIIVFLILIPGIYYLKRKYS